MKRDRVAETETNLRAAEARLRDALLAVLPDVALSGASLFTNHAHNPHGLPIAKLWPQAESIYADALACLEMRAAIGLPADDSTGQLFLAACEEAGSSNEHRRGPRKLAASLLERLSYEG
jgi:hypothetical protein